MALSGITTGRAEFARPRSVLGMGWACVERALTGRAEHRPTTADFSEDVVRRTSFIAGDGFGWRISILVTPRSAPPPWKIVVVTGAPSWAEYWAPIMAALPADREMVVVDRPGYGQSEPAQCVPELSVQARALAPLLKAPRGQKVLLVGQSYGASIATLMAASNPDRVDALVLLSSYLGEGGPTARWLVEAGSRLMGVIPRDLRTAVTEVAGQAAQLPLMWQALARVRAPIHVVHGDNDDFAPISLARGLASQAAGVSPIRFQVVAGGNHFLTSAPAETLLGRLEACLTPTSPTAADRAGRWLVALAGRLASFASPERQSAAAESAGMKGVGLARP